MRKLEKDIEGDFVKYARKHGYQALKFEVRGRRNHPDRQIFLGWGYSFFIEFKRKGEKPRPGQASRIKKWQKLGYSVYVCDNLQDAKNALHNEMRDLEQVLNVL